MRESVFLLIVDWKGPFFLVPLAIVMADLLSFSFRKRDGVFFPNGGPLFFQIKDYFSWLFFFP